MIIKNYKRKQQKYGYNNKKITLDTNRFEKLSKTMDNINTRFGRDSVTIGGLPNKIKSFSGTRIAFTRIPDRQEFNE